MKMDWIDTCMEEEEKIKKKKSKINSSIHCSSADNVKKFLSDVYTGNTNDSVYFLINFHIQSAMAWNFPKN